MSKVSKWIIVGILLFTTFHSTPTTYANTQSVVVDTASLHIRSGPGLTYDVTGSLKKGTQVVVLSTSGDWLEIRDGNNSGWIAAWLTTSLDQSTASATTIVSRVDQLNIRSSPAIGSAVLGRMSAGDEALMTRQDGEWAAITYNGITGWVHSDYITKLVEQTIPTSITEPVEQPASAELFTVAVGALNVRKKADLSSKRVGLISRGETYTVNKTNGNWVQITIDNNKQGWVYSFHGTLSSNGTKTAGQPETGTVTILSNGTNIRAEATTSSESIMLANAGQKFSIIKEDRDWYKIALPTGESAFIAKWVVSTGDEPVTAELVDKEKKSRVPGTLKGLTIVIDAGHGGNDRGTTGTRGTDEKNITLLTSELLAAKLTAAGAEVVMTREADTYVSLRKRVAISSQVGADAFVSIHYDANPDPSVAGFTTYYTHPRQKALASAVNGGLASSVNLRDRGAQPGDFLVLRENRQNAILIELGFLSNATEERTVTTDMFREQATHGIYNGLLDYFDSIE
ncbi:N-acetylmuramoyl-L-alanine amidase [Sporosarcina sp. YIM B06819]|uniref:N-acetylmuramoyl-L-alanine amidase n=1 Tax=Sporosarcina sp. YIM B06819 TaxID=3081769 RepID=UPI00298C76A6|nr:N-acetylmuramoyl-L-alanine amidase [Sporosarcina sp. YIM B06819]